MPHSLHDITTHIRASGRTTTHGAILLAEVDRLRAWIWAMSAEHPTMSRAALAGEPSPTQETANV